MNIDGRNGLVAVRIALAVAFWTGAAGAALADEAQPADAPQAPEVSREPEDQPPLSPPPPAAAEPVEQASATAEKPVASVEREKRDPVPAASPKSAEPFTQFRIVSEAGFLAVAAHTIQFSKDGTKFDYVDEGGQDNAFLVTRHSAELELDARHTVIALYQPLDIRTSVRLDRDVRIDGAVFREGTPVDLRYGFDFYRLSYLFDLFDERPRDELSLGLSLQMRNAAIVFTAADGSLRRANRDVGPVPLLKLRGRWGVSARTWLGMEVDGIWAPIKYINGSDSDVEGALVDLSLRVGYRVVRSLDAFFNVRYLAGGAEGTSSDDSGPGDGYTSNWLHFLTFTVGLEWSPTDLGR